jgi:hypothetical protein
LKTGCLGSICKFWIEEEEEKKWNYSLRHQLLKLERNW